MSQSPHPAILIPEIIEEIFDKLRPHTEEESISGESRVALARAARVCRAFREPATRTPLTGLASVYIDAAVPTSRTKVNRSYTVAQNTAALVHPGEWDVLYRRAAYTRTIFKGSPRFCASSDVHVFLSYKTSGRPLFPNVQALSWFSETLNHLSLLPLLSPTVRMLKLSFGRGVDEAIPMHLMWRWVLLNQNQPDATEGIIIDQLLQTTLPRLGGLVELEVQGSVFVSPMQELESWARIGSLQNLRKLTLDHSCLIVNPAYLQHLAALPVLVELSLHLICDGATVQTSFPGFSALEKLTLDVYARSHEGILDSFISPGLHTHSASVRLEYTAQAAMPAIVNDIARAYPHIRSISLKEHSRQSSEAPSTIPSFDAVFGRLAQHADVEEFVLHTRYGMSICTARDKDFSRLAQSWPRLRLFSFLSAPFGAQPSHHAVLAFAQHCPALRTLHLRGVDFSGLTKETVRALPVSSTHTLEEFGVLFPALRVPTKQPWMCPSCPVQRQNGCTTLRANVPHGGEALIGEVGEDLQGAQDRIE
ncbi:uncharacterized protein TRAVEDRAFT_23436 [Trametes versicolor FP-101664 SS1]|uniref:uncharacterized protein n=1 Tax=Trametes versicolor (strain FP-101664) TaxID=717944 RepID=UPI0004624868|nr:uncharacterized protein TRAVEDRAFT_23436 [Trametes versicolor FP-101664 SS1]EIW54336.1 hypothetical protein TRAVEDRAFT_23436 [Trametes versicolor FP-101664 SS1]